MPSACVGGRPLAGGEGHLAPSPHLRLDHAGDSVPGEGPRFDQEYVQGRTPTGPWSFPRKRESSRVAIPWIPGSPRIDSGASPHSRPRNDPSGSNRGSSPRCQASPQPDEGLTANGRKGRLPQHLAKLRVVGLPRHPAAKQVRGHQARVRGKLSRRDALDDPGQRAAAQLRDLALAQNSRFRAAYWQYSCGSEPARDPAALPQNAEGQPV
jgi:hypothetical protein